MSAAELPNLPGTTAAESQWAIVGRMFRKKSTAVWGLRGAWALVFIAIYTPIVCSGLPFVWREPGGETTYPWLRRLFDEGHWQGRIDILFNMLMVLVTIWLFVRLVLWAVRKIATSGGSATTGADAGPIAGVLRGSDAAWLKLRKKIGRVFTILSVVILLLQSMGASFLISSELYVDYRTQAKVWEAEGADYDASFALVPYDHRQRSRPAEGQEDRGYLDLGTVTEGDMHVLGTDGIGRDLFARLLYGTRISLTVGLLAVAIYATIGIIIGSIAGYAGGRTDLLIMRFIEIVMCVPGLFLILTIIALFEQRSVFMIMVAISLVAWTGIARLVRGEFIRERARDYVSAAKSLGLGNARILFRHILPNAVAPVIVAATFGVAAAIITESTLSFIGLGDATAPSWGKLLNEGRESKEWHMILCPGIAIFFTVTLLNLVGDGLRDALDPKLRA